jgi:hypothetical protein
MYGSIRSNTVELVQEYLDYTRCERADGTTYGTRGKCRKGTEIVHESRRAKGQSLEGQDLDYEKLRSRAREWVKENGLGDPEDVLPGHDEVHILTRDYIGKTGKALGSLMGESSSGGPTNIEEVLVEAFESLSRGKKGNNTELFERSIQETFQLSRGLGVLPENHLYNRNRQRAIDVSVRYLTAISRRPDFEQFILTVKTARRKAREAL